MRLVIPQFLTYLRVGHRVEIRVRDSYPILLYESKGGAIKSYVLRGHECEFDLPADLRDPDLFRRLVLQIGNHLAFNMGGAKHLSLHLHTARSKNGSTLEGITSFFRFGNDVSPDEFARELKRIQGAHFEARDYPPVNP